MVRYLTDEETERAIQRIADSAPPMTADDRARLARLFGFHRTHPTP